jgi:hypothetical protein
VINVSVYLGQTFSPPRPRHRAKKMLANRARVEPDAMRARRAGAQHPMKEASERCYP